MRAHLLSENMKRLMEKHEIRLPSGKRFDMTVRNKRKAECEGCGYFSISRVRCLAMRVCWRAKKPWLHIHTQCPEGFWKD